jgi:hypothetical protein
MIWPTVFEKETSFDFSDLWQALWLNPKIKAIIYIRIAQVLLLLEDQPIANLPFHCRGL